MKKTILLIAVALSFVLPGAALATHVADFVPTADCEGWAADFTVWYLTSSTTADLNYRVVVADADGTEVVRIEESTLLSADGSYGTDYQFGEAWDTELCGDLMVDFSFELVPHGEDRVDLDTGSVAFSCDCGPVEEVCTFTPGYWKNHEEMWPVEFLEVGGMTLSQDDALRLLHRPVRGDATIILAKHLIAAKLNVANGADDSIQRVIDRADRKLRRNEIGSRPCGRKKARMLRIKDKLAAYNEMGCGEGGSGGCNKSAEGEKATTTMVEDTDWGSLKALYR